MLAKAFQQCIKLCLRKGLLLCTWRLRVFLPSPARDPRGVRSLLRQFDVWKFVPPVVTSGSHFGQFSFKIQVLQAQPSPACSFPPGPETSGDQACDGRALNPSMPCKHGVAEGGQRMLGLSPPGPAWVTEAGRCGGGLARLSHAGGTGRGFLDQLQS